MPELSDRNRLEANMAEAFWKEGQRFRKRVLEALEHNAIYMVPLHYWDKHEDQLYILLGGYVYEAALQSYKQLARQAEIHFRDMPTLANIRAAEYAEWYTYDLVKDITDKEVKDLQEVFTEYWHSGWSLQEAEDAIVQKGTYGRARANLIATTEITRASVEGEMHAVSDLEAMGYGMIPTWNTNFDEMVCGECGDNHNKDRGEGWENPPPAHPRCRCWLSWRPVGTEKTPLQRPGPAPAPKPPEKPVIPEGPGTPLGKLFPEPVKTPFTNEIPEGELLDPKIVDEIGLKKYLNRTLPAHPDYKNHFGNYLPREMENRIASRIYDLKSKGYLQQEYLPKEWRLGLQADFPEYTSTIGYYDSNTQQIAFNSKLKYWLQETVEDLEESGWHSVGGNYFEHELGHSAHYNFMEKYLGVEMDYGYLNDAQKEIIGKHVSVYGKKNKREAVAEIFAMLVNDKDVPADVIKYYKSVAGPPVKGRVEYTAEEIANLKWRYR